MSLLDRVFCSTDFDLKFPLATCRALPKGPSDHTPVLWDSGEGFLFPKSRFKFEKWWLQHDEFKHAVTDLWDSIPVGDSHIDTWQGKVRAFRKKFRGWSANIEAANRKKKIELIAEFDTLDRLSEEQNLSTSQKERMDEVMMGLNKIWAMEETKARQRSREKHIKEGDRNTRYFQTVANQRRRKTTIHQMVGPEGVATETVDIQRIATDYYKNLFRYEKKEDININDEFFLEEQKVTEQENLALEAPFTENEIKKAVLDSYADGALGPDGLSFMFYQCFWDLIKKDLMNMFDDFYSDKLDIFRINFAAITLVPKENDACTMNKFRPISLLNCSYNIFTKVLTNRVNLIANRLISNNQSAFIKGRYILESVVTAHEVIHSVLQEWVLGDSSQT